MNAGTSVAKRFQTFYHNLCLTDAQVREGTDHHSGVRKSLNAQYYRYRSESANSFLSGSWGKSTCTRPPRDIDIYFVLPTQTYWRFQLVKGNKQSALLQEVKRILQLTYPSTKLRGDGQVVVVGFYGMSVEVVPAFASLNGQYLICDTHDGGRYKTADPVTEMNYISGCDVTFSGNLRRLIMMMKAWQYHCNVPLKSFCIELAAADFLRQYQWARNSFSYYDWIMRDFLGYLCGRANQFVLVPGTYESIWLGDAWLNRAKTAHSRAVKACHYEVNNYVYPAGEEWQKIFGTQIPLWI